MYFNDNIDAMEAYVPGEQPAAGAKVIKLNTNENPYPPSPKVRDVLDGLDVAALRRYPDALAGEFRSVAADLLSVPPEWILPGDGSDDVIMMIARSALQPGRRCAYPVPTFDFYFTQVQIQGAERIEVPLDDDFRLPVDALIDARADVTFIANPNSPTGIAAPTDALAEIAAGLDGLVVIDEAYADFAEDNALELLDRHENVIILRTLSKG
jgi:histidinol-phosphate aminotransferase